MGISSPPFNKEETCLGMFIATLCMSVFSLIGLFIFILDSKVEAISDEKNNPTPSTKKYQFKEVGSSAYLQLRIIEIDGQRYLIHANGGICPLIQPSEVPYPSNETPSYR